MGTVDRLVRLAIAAAIAGFYFEKAISGTMAIVLLSVAIIFALTSLVSFCPLYLPFGISTRGKKK